MLYKEIRCGECDGIGSIGLEKFLLDNTCKHCNGQGYTYQPVSCKSCSQTNCWDYCNFSEDEKKHHACDYWIEKLPFED